MLNNYTFFILLIRHERQNKEEQEQN